jgi:glutamine synthetase
MEMEHGVRGSHLRVCTFSRRCAAADRRPSSNADPYLVTGKIMATIMEDVEVPEIAPLNKDN